MLYYKVIGKIPKIGTIIDTNESIDYYRINRISKLNRLFNLLYDLSFETNLPFQNILSLVLPNFNPISKFEVNQSLLSKIEIIKLEIIATNFNIHSEFKFFNDFILDKVKTELYNENKFVLPDRFKSNYFFESLSDCYLYCLELGLYKNKNNKIIEVEFVDTIHMEKMDNRLVADFQNHYTSNHFYNQAKKFLTKKTSDNPLFEIIFQGKYKVNRLIPMINV